MKFRKTAFLFFIFLLFCPVPVRSEDAVQNQKELKRAFEVSLFQSLARLEDVRKKRTYRLKSINDSIQKTTEAVNLLENGGNYPGAEKLLQEAAKTNSDNALSELVLADVLDVLGKTEEANQAYLRFLKKAARASTLSQSVMTYENRVVFSEYVGKRLAARGVEVPKPSGNQKLPLLNQLAWEKDSWLRVFVATALPMIVMMGIPFIMIRRAMLDTSFSPWDFEALLPKIYAAFAVGYLVWLMHLFLQVPSLIDPPEREVGLIVILGVLLAISQHGWINYLKIKNKREDPTLMRCPGCKKLIQKLSAICFYCKKEL